MNQPWIFRCYVSANKEELIENWYQSGTPEMRAIFKSRLRFLRDNPRDKWVRPMFDLLSGKCAGLGEVRINANKIQHRPLGFFSSGQIFTFVFCAIEKDRKFVPKGACSIGLSRKGEVISNTERSHVCEIDLE